MAVHRYPAAAPVAPALYLDWRHTGALVIITTPDGASLPASARLEAFTQVVRLDRDWFDFSQANAGGNNIRFSSDSGKPVDFQLEHWDAEKGKASFWVRVPISRGNGRQEVRLHWGNLQPPSASDGKKVFAADNGFVSVLHLEEPNSRLKPYGGYFAFVRISVAFIFQGL